jgi:hypothetical protein
MATISTELLAINMITESLRTALAVSEAMATAHSEGRPVSKDELDALVAARNIAVSNLDKQIAKQGG